MSDNDDNVENEDEEIIDDEEEDDNQVIDDDEEEEGAENKNDDNKNPKEKNEENNEEEDEGENKEANNVEEQAIEEGQNEGGEEGNDEEGQEEGYDQNEDDQNNEGDYQENEVHEIKDPNVAKLMEIDLQTCDKDEIIKLLMSKELIRQPKKDENKIETTENYNLDDNSDMTGNIENNKINSVKKKQAKKRENPAYKNVQSHVGQYLKGDNKKVDKFHIYRNDDDYNNPEFVENFNSATHQLTENNNMDNGEEANPDDADEEIKKILFSENSLVPKKNVKYEISGDEIGEKVNQALSHKQETLEKIMNKYYEEFNEKHTFKPNINKNENEQKRKLNEFLADQQGYLDKVKKRVEELKGKENQKNLKLSQNKPKIDKNSEKIYKKSNKVEEPVHMRLFNKQYQTEKKNLLKDKDKKDNKKEDDKTKKIQKNSPAQKKKKTLNLNEGKDIKDDKDENKKALDKNRLLQLASQPPKPVKEKEKPKKQYLLLNKNIQNLKIRYNNFNNKFKKVIDEYFNSLANIQEKNPNNQQQDNNNNNNNSNNININKEAEVPNQAQNEIPQQNNNNSNQLKLNKLSLEQLHDVLFNLQMLSFKNEAEKKEEEKMESTIQQNENKLVVDMWNILKNQDNTVDVEHLKQFLLSVTGLTNYQYYLEFKARPDAKEIENELNKDEKLGKDDKLEKMLNKQIEEEEKSIDKEDPRNKDSKYVNYDANNRMIILPKNAKKIKSLFNILNLNTLSVVNKNKKENDLENNDELYHPQINKNSQKLYEKYKEKVYSDATSVDPKKKNDPHLEFIERMDVQRKKKLAEIEKKKEENDKNQLAQCTFKPKLENKNIVKKVAGADRFKELFKRGSEKEKNRKDRTQEEIEMEKYGKDCTFKPNLEKESVPENVKFENDIFKEKNYQKFYERMKVGKNERMIKDACENRYGFDESLQDFIKQSKMKEYIMQTGNPEENETLMENNETNENVNNNIQKSGHEGKLSNSDELNSNNINNSNEDNLNNSNNKGNEKKNNPNNMINNVDNNNNVNDADEAELEKKEGIPLLIIDVNIREGVKKKIYVYEGDTSEGLAEKFAKEHNLEPQTKEKLQNLIQNHMLRLLTRIDEENQSLSEKSGTTHMPKTQ